MMRKNSTDETRRKILQAAIHVIASTGAVHFTIDAVAAEARVSKGGTLHHFPTKNALMEALILYTYQLWVERVNIELSKEPDGIAGRWCRAYIRSTFDQTPDDKLQLTALSRIQNAYPDLTTHFSENIRCEGNDGLPVGRALAIQITCDGIWLAELAGMLIATDSELVLIREELENLSKGSP